MCSILLIFLILFVVFDLLQHSAFFYCVEEANSSTQSQSKTILVFTPQGHCITEQVCSSETSTDSLCTSFTRSSFHQPNQSRDGEYDRELPLEVPVLPEIEQEKPRGLSVLWRSLEYRTEAQRGAQDAQLSRRGCGLGQLGRRLEGRLGIEIAQQAQYLPESKCSAGTIPETPWEKYWEEFQRQGEEPTQRERTREGCQDRAILTFSESSSSQCRVLGCFRFNRLHAIIHEHWKPFPACQYRRWHTGDGRSVETSVSRERESTGRRSSLVGQSRQRNGSPGSEEPPSSCQAFGPFQEAAQGYQRPAQSTQIHLAEACHRGHTDVGETIRRIPTSSGNSDRFGRKSPIRDIHHQQSDSASGSGRLWCPLTSLAGTGFSRGYGHCGWFGRSGGGQAPHQAPRGLESLCKLAWSRTGSCHHTDQ